MLLYSESADEGKAVYCWGIIVALVVVRKLSIPSLTHTHARAQTHPCARTHTRLLITAWYR